MEQKELIKIVVVIVVLIFMLQLFTWFKPTQQAAGETPTVAAVATGTAFGRVQSYSKELYVEPWGNFSDIIKELQSEGKVEYVNALGGRGVLFLAKGTDPAEVRGLLVASGAASVFSEATITFAAPVNLTFQNSTAKAYPIGQIGLYLDPITPPGDEIRFNIIADVKDDAIETVTATPAPSVANFTASGSSNCTDKYGLKGDIRWDGRQLDAAELTVMLDTSAANIKYSRNDTVLFSRSLSTAELAEIRGRNISYISDLRPGGFTANATNSSAVVSDLEFLNISLAFPSSTFLAVFDSADTSAAGEKAAAAIAAINLEDTEVSRKCSLTVLNITDVAGKDYVMSSQKMTTDYFVPIGKAEEQEGNFSAAMVAQHIGRIVTEIGGFEFE